MNDCNNRLFNLLYAQEWHLDRLYGHYSQQLGFLFRNYNGRGLSQFKKQELDKILGNFNSDLEKLFLSQIDKGITLSNACSDATVKDYIKNLDIRDSEVQKMLATNTGAASAFANRAAKGFKLSDRVWDLTQQTRESLDVILESGVINGRPAAETARDLQKYLKNPDKQFRRIRNEEGKLMLSKPAKDYHPGQGVYRSSYKNALRLSRNETNIAYRTNDFERRKTMPFVMGQRISLSAAHKITDICDYMVGTYPKDFKFTGYHPGCLCISTSVLLPRDKFKEYLGGGSIDQRHLIKKIPNKAFKYINEHADQIKGWKSQPYFIQDNFQATKKGYKLKF